MITVTLVSPATGTERTIEAQPGQSLMQAAIAANAPGIEGDCGGLLTCATCHVYVREPWLAHLPPPVADEDSMLDFVAAERRPNSRLSCQIALTPELDGLTVELPASQY
ncbi:2Fe-2S iron-sulfur cluster-binding protein [Tepidicella baoligensis]|uniref:2Fe-2S iron-sulfur cluster-binding protein n=1 Tax=Tepidicella baoligensis TaxID=2707016 RepID=UPI0015DB1C7E|nr:2Fe-2S iron-sulfur cluster-binding protein [Tepidicella baoligensis]